MTAEVSVVGVPSAVAAAVREVYDACGGLDLAGNILRAAENGHEALRGYFEWDDAKAAHEHRLQQAQGLVRRVKVTILRPDRPEPVAVRAYIARRELPAAADASPGSFVAIEELAGETDRQALMESIRRDLARVQRKYTHVSDFLAIAAEVLIGEEL